MANKLRYPHLVDTAARLYLELGSTRKVADELGLDPTTCWSYIKRSGIDMSAKNVSKIASKNKTLVVDGITFYWSKKGYYRGVTAPGRREMLSSYMYRKIHGTEKPKWLTVMFKDGDRENYAPENLEFVSASECAKVRTAERLEDCLKCLEKGRETRKKLYEESRTSSSFTQSVRGSHGGETTPKAHGSKSARPRRRRTPRNGATGSPRRPSRTCASPTSATLVRS